MDHEKIFPPWEISLWSTSDKSLKYTSPRSQPKQTDAKSPRPKPLAVSSVHKSVSGIEYSDEDDGKEIHPAHLAAIESQEVREMESSEIVWTVSSTRQYHAFQRFRRYWNESSPEKETGPMEVDVAKQSDDDPSEA